MTAREKALFALRWDVRYWYGQIMEGADLSRCLEELLRLGARINRLEAGE